MKVTRTATQHSLGHKWSTRFLVAGIMLAVLVILPAVAASHASAHSRASLNQLSAAKQAPHKLIHLLLPPGRQTQAAQYSSCDLSGDILCYIWGGEVQQSPRAYIVFWGSSWQGSDSNFAYFMSNYFHNIGGSPYAKILHQYYYCTPFLCAGKVNVNPNFSVGGTWYDTSNPPNSNQCGSIPSISQSSIDAEVSKAFNHWGINDQNATIFLFSPDQYVLHVSSGGCLDTSSSGGCGYHTTNDLFGDQVFAMIPFPVEIPGNYNNCLDSSRQSDPQEQYDVLAKTTSHEQMEAITDPDLNGWSNPAGEIADLCQSNPDDRYQRAAINGKYYDLAQLWDNSRNGTNTNTGCAAKPKGYSNCANAAWYGLVLSPFTSVNGYSVATSLQGEYDAFYYENWCGWLRGANVLTVPPYTFHTGSAYLRTIPTYDSTKYNGPWTVQDNYNPPPYSRTDMYTGTWTSSSCMNVVDDTYMTGDGNNDIIYSGIGTEYCYSAVEYLLLN